MGFDDALRIRHEIDKTLAAHNVDVHVVMQFDNIETLKRAVEINAGISLLPEPTVFREVQAGSLVARSLSDVELIRPLGIIQRRGAELGKTARRFIQLLQDEQRGDDRVPAMVTGGLENGGMATSGKRSPK